MTVKEFYDYATKRGFENAEILISYECDDCWYSFDEKLDEGNIDCFVEENTVCLCF